MLSGPKKLKKLQKLKLLHFYFNMQTEFEKINAQNFTEGIQ